MNQLRRLIRKLLVETYINQSKPKLIFLAGTPGGGKSTAVQNLGLERLFTVCNPDVFYEALLTQHRVPFNLEQLHYDRKEMKALAEDPDYVMSTVEMQRWEEIQRQSKLQSQLMLREAMPQYREQVARMFQEGKNVILDGTAANSRTTLKAKQEYEEAGYDVAMIAIDITVETAIERNTSRGQSGGRTLPRFILHRTAERLQGSMALYENEFDHLWVINNHGSFEDYKDNIAAVREEVIDWVHS